MAHERRLILVTGATGHQGGAVLRHLRAKGFDVRALTRDPDQPAARALLTHGVEMVRGDLDDRNSLARALDGVYGVYSVQNARAGAETEIRQGISLVEAAERAVVSHFVYSSVASADRNTGIPHFDSKFQIEQRIRNTGLPYTILRPVFFMENLLAMRASIDGGTLAMPLKPETRLQMIAVEDIGQFVATVFEHSGKWHDRAIDIAGDEQSISDIAHMLSGAIGREVQYQQVPWEQFDKQTSEDYGLMFRWFDNVGYSVDISALRQDHPNLLTFEHWLHTNWPKVTTAGR